MKKIATLILFFILFGCNKEFSFYSEKDRWEIYEQVNVTNFLEKSTEYNGKKIELIGEFYMDFENIYLIIENKKIYLDFNFYKKLKGGNENLFDGTTLSTFNGEKIKVRGKYVDGITGHIGCCNGKLTEIVFFGSP
jgi:hypothetical protein